MGNMLLLTQHQVADGDFWCEEMSYDVLFEKAGIEGWGYCENVQVFICEDIHYIAI